MDENIKRYDAVNILRMVCAYLVIIIHAVAFQSFGVEAQYITSEFICRIAVPFFFIAAGYFMYLKIDKIGYFKRYISKLIKIFIIVTIINSLLLVPVMLQAFIHMGIGFTIKTFLVNGIVASLWYFPALIISSIFVYFFIKKELVKPLVIIAVILLLIGLMGDSYYGMIKDTPFETIVNAYNVIFDNTRNGFTFGVPFITIGALISKYKLNEKIKKPVVLLMLSCMVFAIEAYFLMHTGISKDYNIYLSATLVVSMIFIMALNSKIKISDKLSNYFREMSLWIYAFHMLILIVVVHISKKSSQNSLLNYLIVCVLSTILAFIITKIKFRKKVFSETSVLIDKQLRI